MKGREEKGREGKVREGKENETKGERRKDVRGNYTVHRGINNREVKVRGNKRKTEIGQDYL